MADLKFDITKAVKSGVAQALKNCELTIGMTLADAVDRQIPKIPTFEGDGYAPDGSFVYDEWLCPCCDTRYEVDYDKYDYCPACGQKIDWSDNDEDKTD